MSYISKNKEKEASQSSENIEKDNEHKKKIETKRIKVTGLTQKSRDKNLEFLKNRMANYGWSFKSADEGWTGVYAIFERTIDEKRWLKKKRFNYFWTSLILGSIIGAMISKFTIEGAPVILIVLVLFLTFFKFKGKKQWKRFGSKTLLGSIVALICAYILLIPHQNSLINQEKYDTYVAEANTALDSKNYLIAIHKLKEATKISVKNEGNAKLILDELEKATSKEELANFLGDLSDSQFEIFLKTEDLPKVTSFKEPRVNTIFKNIIIDSKTNAIKIRMGEIKARETKRKEKELAKKKRLAEIKERKKQEAEAKKHTKKIAELEKKIGEKPVQSQWDGSVQIAENYLKSHLRDPDSLKYESWSPVFLFENKNNKYWATRVTYRAKNGFGGFTKESKMFLIQHGQVVSVLNLK